ncbi:MAG: carboxypeptidase-like regulatory domain-containing protein, partial [Prevotella sp.]|nr:carboxypeptidase-like regulatory domain-containing protein [Prevotella sp.]
VSEFVVTNIQPHARPIRGRESFRQRDNLYDRVEYFSDPDFWGADNIIEPTEALNRAVERLRRSVERTVGE